MREVEVKAKISNKERLLSSLKDLNCVLGERILQKDRIFVPKGSILPVDNFVNVLRIREQGEKNILTLKYSVSTQLDKRERELEVSNPDTMAQIIEDLGFEEIARVEKTRQKCVYKDMEICFDSVLGLGEFIEVERIVPDDTKEEVQEDLMQFLLSLGVLPEDRVFDGYDVLMYKQQHENN